MKYTSDDNVARYKPLVGVNKKFVEYLYRYFNIMDTIYPLTRSGINLTIDHPYPCKQCPWCEEKYWAFGTYDLV